MSKWKGSYDSGRPYRTEWEKEYAWVTRAKDGSQQALCKVCVTILQPRKATLKAHDNSREHQQRISAVSSTRANVFQTSGLWKQQGHSEELKKAELELAAAVSCHCSVASVDHFSEIIMRNGAESNLENLRLHRTKCSMLIMNVISPSLEEDLRKRVNDAKYYCLLVDESTDVSSEKNLCVCVRFYDGNICQVVTAFLRLVPVTEATGAALFEATRALLVKNGIAIEKCIGFSSDGSSNMTGETNSVVKD